MAMFSDIKAYANKRNEDYFKNLLSQKARKNRFPCQIHFELTPLCTLNCQMCYVHVKESELTAPILDGERWIDFARQSTKLGSLYVTLSGGEPLLHKDFFRIYKELYDMGLLISVMTNGTLIDQQAIDFFLEYPPEAIYITMYGFSESTYEKVCGTEKAFCKVVDGINLLVKAGLPLKLHTTATKEMYADIPKIVEFASERQIPYRFSNVIFPFGVATPEMINAHYMTESSFSELMKQVYSDYEYERPLYIGNKTIEKGLLCGAARDSFSVNWKGEMRPCVSLDVFNISLLHSSVENAWKQMVQIADNIPLLVECQKCIFQNYCTRCVAQHYADTHEFGKPSPRICWKRLYPEKASKIEASLKEKEINDSIQAITNPFPQEHCPDSH